MKTEELKALGLNDEQVQRVFAMNGADVNREKQAAETAKAERDVMRTQLDEANTKLKGYDPDWQQKATDAQKAADAKVAELQAGYAAQNILPNCVKNARSSLTISALRVITWGGEFANMQLICIWVTASMK